MYTLAYIIKFKIARRKGYDYKVNPLEVKWFLDKKEKKIDFTWKAMIMQPDIITRDDVEEAMELCRQQGKEISYEKLKFESISFGRCIQCFHLGDYNQMNDTMYKMQELAKENGLEFDLYTHDIYLNDSRKTKTENLKTIMRIGVY